MTKTKPLTDSETRAALLSAGVPRRYHKKDMSVENVGHGAAIKAWLDLMCQNHRYDSFVDPEDDTKSLFLYGEGSDEAAYLAARGLLLMGVSAMVIVVPELFDGEVTRDGQFLDRVKNSLVLVLMGYNDEGISTPGPEEYLFGVQWWLHRAMDNGKLFVFQGCRMPCDGDHWGRTFQKKVRRECTIVKCGEV